MKLVFKYINNRNNILELKMDWEHKVKYKKNDDVKWGF